MNNSGKTLVLFLSVISILLVSITAISVFLLIKEAESRKAAEYDLEQARVLEAKLQTDFKEARKKVLLLENKEKESEEKIESLMEDLELEQGLREEIKKENRELREARDALEAVEEELRKNLSAAEEKNAALMEQLGLTSSQNKELEERRRELEKQYQEIEENWGPFETSFNIPTGELTEELQASLGLMDRDSVDVDLDRIIVSSFQEQKGEIISIDRETNFIIVNLGRKDGIKKDAVLAIYRGNQYLGDVRVSRVLPEMSAADFILPFKSQDVRSEDRAVIRQ